MTTSATLAADLWQRLIDGVVPPFGAIEELMETEGCDRPKVLAMLHEAAADWMHERFVEGDHTGWNQTPREVEVFIRSGRTNLKGICGRFDPIDDIRKHEQFVTREWDSWCNRADQAVAILRTLAEIP